jgi:hypothetical protein
MREVTEDDALVGLLFAVISQAVEDYQLLERRGVITKGKPVGLHKMGIYKKGSQRGKFDGMFKEHEVHALLHFLKGRDLESLCDFIGQQPCRIRRKLGII